MNDLEEYPHLKATTQHTPLGIVTTLETPHGLSHKNQIGWQGKTMLAYYVYHENQAYDVVYSLIDAQGNAEKHWQEKEGVLPSLLLAPDQMPWVNLVPYHPDKETEVTIPLFNREGRELPKGNRPFPGKYVGNTGAFSVFHDTDIFSASKPDKLLLIEFKANQLKKKHNKKITLPSANRILLSDDAIHLLARDKDNYLHRALNQSGEKTLQRTLNLKSSFLWQALSLSFDSASLVLTYRDGGFWVLEIAPDGNSASEHLLMPFGDKIYSIWPPVLLGSDVRIVRFTYESGNGWLTLQQTQLLEFFHQKDDVTGCYTNQITGDTLHLGSEHFVLSGITATGDNAYAATFYPKEPQTTKGNSSLHIFNRSF